MFRRHPALAVSSLQKSPHAKLRSAQLTLYHTASGGSGTAERCGSSGRAEVTSARVISAATNDVAGSSKGKRRGKKCRRGGAECVEGNSHAAEGPPNAIRGIAPTAESDRASSFRADPTDDQLTPAMLFERQPYRVQAGTRDGTSLFKTIARELDSLRASTDALIASTNFDLVSPLDYMLARVWNQSMTVRESAIATIIPFSFVENVMAETGFRHGKKIDSATISMIQATRLPSNTTRTTRYKPEKDTSLLISSVVRQYVEADRAFLCLHGRSRRI
ncbi:unnamed protein product [Phytophthora lilii]|uniref:Unnamed protein product n=1 Tax=Phytophthora lilii TaxID=2077276 RepID=A0A9W7CMS0_9STRA|nr:unnamed protein product [Phytophthora lilii]